MASPAPSASLHIVVINAEAEFLNVVRVLLESEGFRVSTMHVDESPYDYILDVAPAGIVLDFTYERPEAWSLLAVLDGDERTRLIPLLATSTDASILDRVLDASSHRTRKSMLVKPLELDDLIVAVQDLCGRLSPQ
jgi:DNA-binding response OmpR family regulator